ncbi:hypothetical protein JOL62DRAFT_561226 [Phyllosticta paracitricarpa]|uniref:Uncharacterized protein n=1 Tax=Phyllosticta paracitricarpa TaxID=2016321 RepID=A0ABR1NJQ1_9PEZI
MDRRDLLLFSKLVGRSILDQTRNKRRMRCCSLQASKQGLDMGRLSLSHAPTHTPVKLLATHLIPPRSPWLAGRWGFALARAHPGRCAAGSTLLFFLFSHGYCAALAALTCLVVRARGRSPRDTRAEQQAGFGWQAERQASQAPWRWSLRVHRVWGLGLGWSALDSEVMDV